MGRFQWAKCAACQKCISRWNLPYQLLQVSPVSCGGSEPAHWMAVRYCERTMRRSSSRARGSEAAERSMVAPVFQKSAQCVRLAAKVEATVGRPPRGMLREKAQTN